MLLINWIEWDVICIQNMHRCIRLNDDSCGLVEFTIHETLRIESNVHAFNGTAQKYSIQFEMPSIRLLLFN